MEVIRKFILGFVAWYGNMVQNKTGAVAIAHILIALICTLNEWTELLFTFIAILVITPPKYDPWIILKTKRGGQ